MPDFGRQLEAISFPLIGNSLIIGLFSLLHISIAGLTVGFMVLAPLLETVGRVKPHYTDFARSLTRFTIITFSISTVLAVIMVELSIGLFPVTTMWLWNQFRWPLVLAAAAFLLMLMVLYPYYHYWDDVRRSHRRLHIMMGYLAAFLVMVWVMVLDGMGAAMLTPRVGAGPWDRLANSSWIPLVLHRFFGNLVLAGFAMTAYAGWRLRAQRGQPDETYYMHFLQIGFFIGLLALLVQPATGLLYAANIQETAPEAYAQLTQGPYRGYLSAQFLLIAGLFLGALALLHLTLGSSSPLSRGVPSLAAVSALLTVAFAASPTLRRPIMFVLVGLVSWDLDQSRSTLLKVPDARANHPLVGPMAIFLGIVALMTYLVMGTIRETARRPDTVRGVISLQDELQHPAADRGRP